MKNSNNHKEEIGRDSSFDGKDRRNERRTRNLLRNANNLGEDEWDDFEINDREIKHKRNRSS